MSAKPRPYMRMHAVRGFTRREAVSFLRESRGLEIDEAMIEAVLENTLDRGKPAGMEDVEGPGEEPRYSPIDVRLYANWIEWDSTLEPSRSAGGNQDVYVDVRIFRRSSRRGSGRRSPQRCCSSGSTGRTSHRRLGATRWRAGKRSTG